MVYPIYAMVELFSQDKINVGSPEIEIDTIDQAGGIEPALSSQDGIEIEKSKWPLKEKLKPNQPNKEVWLSHP